jgi:outer membrane protein assembly factor BamD (BamD/ComL family)
LKKSRIQIIRRKETAWGATQIANTIPDFEKFCLDFPESSHFKQAQEKLNQFHQENVDWGESFV